MDGVEAHVAPLAKFNHLRLWIRNGERAVHKPLLVLLALSRLKNSNERWLPFRDIVEPLTRLLKEFGPPRDTVHPEYPYWRLQNDEVWIVRSDTPLLSRKSNTDPKKSELLAKGAVAGFTDDVIAEFQKDPQAIETVTYGLLEAHFPESVQSDLIDFLQLAFSTPLRTTFRRDPKFRDDVLRAYNYRCAICCYELRLRDELIGLEAAHIRWVQADGPDSVNNGIALCSLHHKQLDRGAFTIAPNLRIVCSKELVDRGTPSSLAQFHGALINGPADKADTPNKAFLTWHLSEVFRKPPLSAVPTE